MTRERYLLMGLSGPIVSLGMQEPPLLLQMETEGLFTRPEIVSDCPMFILTEKGQEAATKLAQNAEIS